MQVTQERLLETLDQNLAFAISQLARSRAAFENFELQLKATGKAMHLWHPVILKRHSLLKKHHAADVRLFNATADALRAHHSAARTSAARLFDKDKPADEPAIPQPVAITKTLFHQNVEITIVDGKVHTSVDADALQWLDIKSRVTELALGFKRHYYFPNSQIPELYAHVMQHNGAYFGPAESIFITYSPEEFMRLCQLEVDSNAEHVIDGERSGYYHLP